MKILAIRTACVWIKYYQTGFKIKIQEYFDLKIYQINLQVNFRWIPQLEDMRYLIKDAFKMEVWGLARKEVGLWKRYFKLEEYEERKSEGLIHIMIEILRLIMIYIIKILLMFLYILISYTRITLLFRLNQMTFHSFCIHSTIPITHYALLNLNPFLYLDTNL